MSEIPEHTTEPVPGLPEQLPRNEKILWQGKPDWLQFAIHATHARKLAIYFGALLVWRLVTEPGGGHGKFLALSVLGVGIIVLLAWLMTRSALYTITDRRVVMRFGVAIPISINLPFADIASAQLRQVSRASGDILLVARSAPANRLSYLICWPHVRPWHISVSSPASSSRPAGPGCSPEPAARSRWIGAVTP